jgi:hypothetical protein
VQHTRDGRLPEVSNLTSEPRLADQLPSRPQEYARPLAQAPGYTGQAKVAMGISTSSLAKAMRGPGESYGDLIRVARGVSHLLC